LSKRIACRLKTENFGCKPFKPHRVTTVTLDRLSGFSLEIFNFHLDMGLLSGSGGIVRFLRTPVASLVRPAGLSFDSFPAVAENGLGTASRLFLLE